MFRAIVCRQNDMMETRYVHGQRRPKPLCGFACVSQATHMKYESEILAARHRRDELAVALRHVQNEIVTEGKRARERVRSTENVINIDAKSCTPRWRGTAVVLYRSEKDAGVTARRFLEDTLSQKWGIRADAEKFMDRIQTLSVAVPESNTASTLWWCRRTADAENYVREKELHDWIETQNETRGIAPTTRAILWKRTKESTDTPQGRTIREAPLHPSLPRRQVQWTRRFMRRWAMRRGALPAGTGMPEDEAARKARRGKTHFRPGFFGPKFVSGATFAGHFRRPENGRRSAATKPPVHYGRVRIPAGENGPRKRAPECEFLGKSRRPRCGGGRTFWRQACPRRRLSSTSISTRHPAASGHLRAGDYCPQRRMSK